MKAIIYFNFLKKCTPIVIMLLCLAFDDSNGQNKITNINFDNLKAIQRTDNSFVTFHDSYSPKKTVPPIVINKIENLYKQTNNSINTWQSEQNNPTVFKVRYNKNIDIFIVKIYFFNGILYRLIALNKDTNIVTASPPTINGKWMENREGGFPADIRFLTDPLIYFKDFCQLGSNQIIVKERVHNGTAYNAEVDHVYKLDEKMSFVNILCNESKYWYETAHCLIHRALKKNVILSELIGGNNKPLIVGEVKLNLTRADKIVQKKVYNSEFKNLLITGSDVKENTFLKSGYTFKY